MGARNELNKALGELDNDVIKNFFLSQDCDWLMFLTRPTWAGYGRDLSGQFDKY